MAPNFFSFTFGDKGASTDDGHVQKHIVKGKIKAGGDFRLGDDMDKGSK